MTKDDAKAFLIAMNNVAQYVPPMHFAPIATSPVARLIEQIANAPEEQPERPKPRIVEDAG